MASLCEWKNLALNYGPKCVMNLRMTDGELHKETLRQVNAIAWLMRPLLRNTDRLALDYGCGAGRFTPMLGYLVGNAVGFDPCVELIDLAPTHGRASYCTGSPDDFFAESATFDVIFLWCVLGGLENDVLPKLADDLISLLAPGGLLVVADHIGLHDGKRWWKFRCEEYYTALFGETRGCPVEKIGVVDQLENPVTVFAGRKIA